MKTHNKFACCIVTLAFAGSAHADNIHTATRVSVDGIVGQGMSSGPELGYHDGNPSSSTLIGAAGSIPGNSRYNQNIVYRYTLPTLNPGETIQSFTFSFDITEVRHDGATGNGHELDVYLLDVFDPTTTGTGLFYQGSNETNHAFLGSQFIATTTQAAEVQDPALAVAITINSGPALTLLQSFYGGDHIPDQTEASFRFNLDRSPSPSFNQGGGNDRYRVDDNPLSSSFVITAVPASTAFLLTITPATAPATGFDLAWDSQVGKTYNLRTSTDLTGAISTWTLVEGGIEATPPTNTYSVDSADPRRFYAVEEIDEP